MQRIFLYVPPEEYAEVKASGACWDDGSKRWYIQSDTAPASFSQWLGDEEVEAEFSFTSDDAFVACAQASCSRCHEKHEVICIYCESGTDSEIGEPMRQFTLSNVWAMNNALATQLEGWPCFRKEIGADTEEGYFANHCPYC